MNELLLSPDQIRTILQDGSSIHSMAIDSGVPYNRLRNLMKKADYKARYDDIQKLSRYIALWLVEEELAAREQSA